MHKFYAATVIHYQAIFAAVVCNVTMGSMNPLLESLLCAYIGCSKMAVSKCIIAIYT